MLAIIWKDLVLEARSRDYVEHRIRASGQHQRTLDPDGAMVFARSQFDDIAGTRAVQQRRCRLVRCSRRPSLR